MSVADQLSLIPPPIATGSVPLVEALRVQAAVWSTRLGYEVRVVELSNGAGYRIGRTA